MGLPLGTVASDFDLFPSGVGQPFFGDSASVPTGWLLCDGSAVSRATYASLFAAIGTKYGAGDGSTTFNLPDARGRVLVGVGTHADVNDRGLSDGLAVGSRRPAHAHSHSLTLPNHAHSHSLTLPNHAHSHTIATSSSGGHNAGHSLTVDNHDHGVTTHFHNGGTGNGNNGGFGTPAGSFAAAAYAVDHQHGFSTSGVFGVVFQAPGVGGTITVANHTHTITGSVGNPTSNPSISGSVGNPTSNPAIDGSISSATPSFLTVHWIIKT